MKKILLSLLVVLVSLTITIAQEEADLEKLRTQSGVDPTRVATRVGYLLLIQNPPGEKGSIINRVALNLGVNRWGLSVKYEAVSQTLGDDGTGFGSSFGDLRFSILNAFFVEGPHAFAGSVEFLVPLSKTGFGSQYFSAMPGLTYSFTINPSLFFAVQPQYLFDLMKGSGYPELSVLSVRTFIAKFWESGLFLVIEPRPVYNFTDKNFNLIIAPIIGQALGGGYNLIFIAEFPTKENTFNTLGPLYQIGFNKSF